MRALALRLEGPLQSWGAAAVGPMRPTLDTPTASGVLGLIGAALGIERPEVARLVDLHRGLALAVRTDRAGEVMVDYHTAMDVPGDDGGVAETQITRRRYLADASFAVALVARGGHEDLLPHVARALRRPRYALALGRRACVPALPVLAAHDLLEGDDWRALLAQIPSTPRCDRDPVDAVAWVDAELTTERGLREIHQRDRLVGPLTRMFLDRRTKQFWATRPAVDERLAALLGVDVAPRMQRRPDLPVTPDTIEEFFG